MKKILYGTLFLSLALVAAAPAEAGIFSFLHKKKKTEKKAEPKKTPYEKILTDRPIQTASGPLMKLHKSDGKLYLDIPKANLGKDLLIGATIASISNPSLGNVGFRNSNPVHFRFIQKDSTVVMDIVNTELLTTAEPTKEMAASIKQNYKNLSFLSFPIKGWSKDSASVLIDASSFFLKDNRFFPVIEGSSSGIEVQEEQRDDLTHIKTLKSFKNNVSILVERSYKATISAGPASRTITNYPVTAGINFTILALPEKPMTPRLSDTRIGIFLTSKNVLHEGRIEPATFARRWRVEPKDEAAFAAGQLVEPKKPIVYYVDPAFPPVWRKAIDVGVVRWNDAFEKIGFKNVVQVRDYPTDDPEFDPDNLEYTCIRFVPTGVENAMGPSWSDPRSGEIINGSTFIYRGVNSILANWRFIQTAQIDESVRTKKMPEAALQKSLEYVLAHEIGHTLGFMHNMGASFSYPVDSLRSKSFTDKYGTTPSIMDYARHNYVAQVGDPVTNLDPPPIGLYDYYAVEWAYKYFPELKGDFVAENKELCKLIEKHAHDLRYRYGLQQDNPILDPSSLTEDLGDDPIKAGDYGMKNLKFIISHLGEWIKDDESSERKGSLYREALSQAYRYVNNVQVNVAGIYLQQSSESSGIPRYRVVPRDKQRASAQWLLNQARDFSQMSNRELEAILPYAANRPFDLLVNNLQAMAINQTSRLALSAYLDSTSYTPAEYAEDVFNNVFEKTLAGKENLTDQEMRFQALYVKYIGGNVESATRPTALQVGLTQNSKADFEASLKGGLDAAPLTPEALRHQLLATNGHVQDASIKEAANLCGTCVHDNTASQVGFLNFGKGYGEQADLWGNMVNRSAVVLFGYAVKTLELLEKSAKTAKNPEVRAHYQNLHTRLKKKFDL
ncbi:zinc-dependent metalloprotease [Ihuprevotella massiliensis]|uniref:zinc-dependent metalloprotease n=1 Tax=Ihuprevotella massiliensis TaxID=1852368 RepID=UPI0009F21139